MDIMNKGCTKTNQQQLQAVIDRLFNEKEAVLNVSDLKVLFHLISDPIPEEKALYREYLLKVPEQDHPRNNLYHVLRTSDISSSEYNLYGFIHAVTKHPEAGTELKYFLPILARRNSLTSYRIYSTRVALK